MTRRVYLMADVLEILHMSRTTFWRLREAGRLPYVEEVLPRAGRIRRYRADLIDRYVANQWTGGRRPSASR